MLQFQTIDQNGRKGPKIAAERYLAIRDFVLGTFGARSQLSFDYLMHLADESELFKKNGNSLWHLLLVKNDMHGRGIIRIKFLAGHPKIQMLHLNKSSLRQYLELTSAKQLLTRAA